MSTNVASNASPSETLPVRPPPSRSAWTEAFWDAANVHQFLLWHCRTCGAWYWPPAHCRNHRNEPWAENMNWDSASGLGRVFTFNITYQQFHPYFPPPYVYALVELDEGPLFSTNIVNCEPERVFTGLRVAVTFKNFIGPDGTPFSLPLFEPTEGDDPVSGTGATPT